MKPIKKILLTACVGIFLLGGTSFAYMETFTTGEDWVERMSPKEKLISLFVPWILFQKYGVPLRYNARHYVSKIDRVLAYNPYLEKEDIANILASTLYVYEPESREAIESMAREFRLRREGYNEDFFPRLLIG